MGFSALGLSGACWKLIRTATRRFNAYRDKRRYGTEVEVLKRQALRDGSFEAGQIASLHSTLTAKKIEVAERLRTTLAEECSRHLSRIAPGSTTLKYSDLLTGPPMLMPCELLDLDGHAIQSTEDYLLTIEEQLAQGKIEELLKHRLFLLGPAGAGKSLFCLQVQTRIEARAKQSDSFSCVQLSVDDFSRCDPRTTSIIGSREWCGELLARRYAYPTDEPSSLEIRLLGDISEENVIFLIDALDEIAQVLPFADFEDLLSSWLFQRAAIVSARRSFYQSKLQGAPQLKPFNMMWLDEPSEPVRRRFLRAICFRGGSNHSESDAKYRTALSMLEELPALADVVHTPLLLLMLAEFAAGDQQRDDTVDMVDIYKNFIKRVLANEARRAHGEISEHSLYDLFQDLAWAAFADRVDRHGACAVDKSLLRSLLQKHLGAVPISTVERIELAVSTSAILSSSGRASPPHAGLGFTHETFLEFLIAAMLNDWLLSKRSEGKVFFQYLETPGISFFVKELIHRIRMNPVEAAHARHRLWDLFNNQSGMRQSATDDNTARLASFAAGQVAYYLGHLAENEDRARLESIATDEKDFWVRRAAAIGLAFCADPSPYHALIDEMRRGMDSGDFTLCRKHIAMELGFYGDQEFDRRDPSLDRGGGSCRRLVTIAATQSQHAVEQANWRMDLFDLVYLSKHRPASSEEFKLVLFEVKESLAKTLSRLEENIAYLQYPELREVRALINNATS
jgi:hypothetical protein